MRVAAIIVAAGRGERAGGGLPKQFRPLGGETVLRRSLRLFAAHPQVEAVQPVIDRAQDAAYAALAQGIGKLLAPVTGGATRQGSVRAGLEAIAETAPEIVLVHDAARPLASATLVDRALDAVAVTGAAVPALALPDTIKRVDADGRVTETLDRSALRAIQTPQVFSFARLLDAHRRAAKAGRNDFPDDAALAEWAGLQVTTFAGEAGNLKLTGPDDFARALALDTMSLSDVRTGTGFDVHAFGPGDHVMLGGVKIPHVKALMGHSDADVLLHALTDAVLGAIAEGDIGKHFPPSDPKWRGASSDQFLAHAVALLSARGGRVAHLDATILCEAPKIAPHADAIRTRIAAIAGIEASRVSVKATTTEGLGFLGRGEGIAAMAMATVRIPWSAQ
ncbi:MAG: bifunctional 2-C-methyl-D-erythritol 4-phosphate cytidylyltransferase/2-C-methyl-D-erythritol 2,4-cyclodiphosphate synthase [Xanthobacteraceae bacterium]